MAWQKLTRKLFNQLHKEYFKNLDNRYQAFDVSPKENLSIEEIEFYEEHLKKLCHDFKNDHLRYKYVTEFCNYLQIYMKENNKLIASKRIKAK